MSETESLRRLQYRSDMIQLSLAPIGSKNPAEKSVERLLQIIQDGNRGHGEKRSDSLKEFKVEPPANWMCCMVKKEMNEE